MVKILLIPKLECGSIETIIHRLKNPKGQGLQSNHEGRSPEWLDWKDRGIFQSMNYFFAGSTFQFGIRRISTLVLTVPVMLLPIWNIPILEKLAPYPLLFWRKVQKELKKLFFIQRFDEKMGFFGNYAFFSPSGMDWSIQASGPVAWIGKSN